jgi:hypothetical protein
MDALAIPLVMSMASTSLNWTRIFLLPSAIIF